MSTCKKCDELQAIFGNTPMVPPVDESQFPEVSFGCGLGVVHVTYPDGRTITFADYGDGREYSGMPNRLLESFDEVPR